MNPVTLQKIDTLRENYLKDEKARVVRNALVKNDIGTISRNFDAERNNPNIFSIDLKTMPVTNQYQSGRCWIFSSMNVLRELIAKKYNMAEFELSQNYIAFYDKLEKANWFMECTLQEIDGPVGSDNMRFLLEWAVGDGGQWNMLVSLVKKYGIAPKSAMPDTYQGSHTSKMNTILNRRLRKFAVDSRKLAQAGKKDEIPALKETALREIYGLIASCFGLPPQEFTFEYNDKDGNYHAEYHVKPLDFYANLGIDLSDYISVIHGPTADKPFHKTYTVKYLGNVVDGEQVKLLNLPMDELKAEMLDYKESAMNHAMVLTGVNLVDEKPTRWKIENSWGEKIGNKGYFIASDSWFDEYTYVVAVHKKYLSETSQKALLEEPKELLPWDPFGTLAD